uniref:Uncharacterized protein n=1 Tax=Peronospora matthiolae TaxID=2874970 RepID=A0AAV1U9N8_9STRA
MPIGDEWYEILGYDAALLETANSGEHRATRQTYAPRVLDWNLAKRVLRYLEGTATLKLEMAPERTSRDTLQLEAYSDADYAADRADRKSLTRGFVLLNAMAVSWTTKKQGGLSLSKMESEFGAASEVVRELIGLKQMLEKVGMAPVVSMLMYVGNQAAISQIEGEAYSIKASTSM